jgi:hypothetical protein
VKQGGTTTAECTHMVVIQYWKSVVKHKLAHTPQFPVEHQKKAETEIWTVHRGCFEF